MNVSFKSALSSVQYPVKFVVAGYTLASATNLVINVAFQGLSYVKSLSSAQNLLQHSIVSLKIAPFCIVAVVFGSIFAKMINDIPEKALANYTDCLMFYQVKDINDRLANLEQKVSSAPTV